MNTAFTAYKKSGTRIRRQIHPTLHSRTLSSGTLMDSALTPLNLHHVCRKHPYPLQSAFLTDYVLCRYEHITSERTNSGTAMLTLDNIFFCRAILRNSDC